MISDQRSSAEICGCFPVPLLAPRLRGEILVFAHHKTHSTPESYNFVLHFAVILILHSWRHPVDDLPEKPAKQDKNDKPEK